MVEFIDSIIFFFLVPSLLFSGECAENHVALVASIYDSFGDPGRKNPVSIPINKMKLDSRIMEVNIASIPKTALKPHLADCRPDLKLLIRRPLRLRFELKSGVNQSRSHVKDGSRKLQFHGDEAPKEIQSRYCAVWNPKIDSKGAWDRDDVKMVWSDEYVAECISTRFGTFGIIGEIYEPPSVPDDKQWLLITKMVGYGVSIMLLSVFIVSVLFSKCLWEMFHILGMNFAFSLLAANVFMVVSELPTIRENHDHCTLVGFGINLFYVATAALLLFLAFAVFMATTYGIIGGYTQVYLSYGWGMAFIVFGYNVYNNLDLMGNDPRCMIGWENSSKTLFGGIIILAALLAVILMLVVMCNMHTSALRKRVFVEELSSLARGKYKKCLKIIVT